MSKQNLLPILCHYLRFYLRLHILGWRRSLNDLFKNLAIDSCVLAQGVNKLLTIVPRWDENGIFLIRRGLLLELLIVQTVQDIFIKDLQIASLMYLSKYQGCSVVQAMLPYVFLDEVNVLFKELCPIPTPN
jgi:hypothetical protein